MSKYQISYCCLIFTYVISGCSGYGYHSASEELDSTTREKSWTRNILWLQRNNKKFIPRFSLNKPKNVSQTVPPVNKISSDFDRKPINWSESVNEPGSAVLLSSTEATKDLFNNKNRVRKNRPMSPIYFTNPLTGILYSLTELGVYQNGSQSQSPNEGIPIFVSKSQYDRDMYLLKKSYESKCNREQNPEILKMNSSITSLNQVEHTTEPNQINSKKEKRRPHRHRKVKKTKAMKNSQVVTDGLDPLQGNIAVDTQLEKPNNMLLSPSATPYSTAMKLTQNSTVKRRIHRVLKRSIPMTPSTNSSYPLHRRSKILNMNKTLTNPKTMISTKITITSELFEPMIKENTPRSVRNRITPPPIVPTVSIPCDKTRTQKTDTSSEEYDDYYDFFGMTYGDYRPLNEDNDKDSFEAFEEVEKLENTISNSDSAVPANQDYHVNKASKKRIKRRNPSPNDYVEDYENDSDDGPLDIFADLFSPVQWIMYKVFDKAEEMFSKKPETEMPETRNPKNPQYTIYNSESSQEEDNDSSIGSWFGSLFGYKRQNTNTVVTEAESSWLETLFGYGDKTPTQDEESSDPWFFGWFSSKPRLKRTTTTTTTTTPVPVATTLSDPLKNPQKWIGILAQHIIESASNTYKNVSAPKKPIISPEGTSYEKYQIWRLKPKNLSQVKSLEKYKQGGSGSRLQWLQGPTLRGLTDVLIPPKMLSDFQATLTDEVIAYEILIFDVGKAISYENARQEDLMPAKPGVGKPIMSWNRFYDFDNIIRYLEIVQARNPHIVELIHIGRSYEGRPLIVAKIESRKLNHKQRVSQKSKFKKRGELGSSGVFVEAGVHGREWIAPASANWMISELLKIIKSNRTNLEAELVKNTTWYIMPVANPDGYEYSHKHDRMWRKSRSRNIAKPNGIINSAMVWLQNKNPEKVCYGVDLDRNWSYNWERKESPCNEFFAGPRPFSEPETKAISKFLIDYRKHIKLFISLQAYGQIITYPSKFNLSIHSQKLDDLLEVAMFGIDGIRKKGSMSRYKVDSTNDLIENKSGSSDYFAGLEVGIPFSYTIYLADNGVHGFLLPGAYIEPTAKDAFQIITAMVEYI